MGVGHASLASEFPNDNAEISGGSIWVCHDLTGPASLVTPPFAPVPAEPFVFWFEEEDGACEGPIQIEATADGPRITVTTTSALPTSEDEDAPRLLASDAPVAPAFAHFERALVTALLAQGASRAAAILPKMLRLEPIPSDTLSNEAQLTLQSRGYVETSGRYSPKFRELCGAWSAVLRGDSSDFAACGTTTLDRFGAELLSALLAVPASRADELRRELRKSGIAAFGVLEAA